MTKKKKRKAGGCGLHPITQETCQIGGIPLETDIDCGRPVMAQDELDKLNPPNVTHPGPIFHPGKRPLSDLNDTELYNYMDYCNDCAELSEQWRFANLEWLKRFRAIDHTK